MTDIQKKNRGKKTLVVLIILIVLAGTGFLGYNLLNIRTLAVSGNEKKTAAYIIGLSGIQTGSNMLRLNDQTVQLNIEKDPYLKFIKIEKDYPDKVVLYVQERKPAALCKNENAYLLLDDEGMVLEMPKSITALSYPVISGMDTSNCKIGKPVAFVDKAQYIAVNTILAAILAKGANSLIAEADFLNINDIKMKTKSGIVIKFGNCSLPEQKILWINEVIKRLDAQGLKTGTVDVSTGQSATYSKT